MKTKSHERQLFREQASKPLGIPNQTFTLAMLDDVDAMRECLIETRHDLMLLEPQHDARDERLRKDAILRIERVLAFP